MAAPSLQRCRSIAPHPAEPMIERLAEEVDRERSLSSICDVQ